MSNPYEAGAGSALSSSQPTSSQQTDQSLKATENVSKRDAFGFIASFVKPYRGWLVLCLVLACISLTAQLTIPVLIGQGIDTLIGKEQVKFDQLAQICRLLAVCIVIGSAFNFLQTSILTDKASAIIYDLRNQVFTQTLHLDMGAIDSHPHGDLVLRIIWDVNQVSRGLLESGNEFIQGIISILGTLLFMFYLSWQIALLVVCLTPLSIFVAYMISNRSHIHFTRQVQHQGELTSLATEDFQLIDTLHATQYTPLAREKFSQANKQLNEAGLKAQFISSLSNPATRFVNNIVFAAVACFGFAGIVTGSLALTVGGVQAFLSYANQYTKPFNQITATFTQLQAAVASSQRLFYICQMESSPEFQGALAQSEREAGEAELDGPSQGEEAVSVAPDRFDSIAFEEVDFGYVPDKLVLKDVSFQAKPGQKVALVGESGSGKTTLINLIMKFYNPNSGVIRIGGVDTQQLSYDSIREHIGMVLQESWLFSGTIAENISFGTNASDEEIQQAARLAQADGFINRLPEGYETHIDPEKGQLSKGEMQLICIARTMLKDPDLLILDEATSAIDSMTEIKVQRAFDQLIAGRTSLIVAHRLATIQNADLILVMKEGQIIERGTHQQLLAQDGYYAKLYYRGNIDSEDN